MGVVEGPVGVPEPDAVTRPHSRAPRFRYELVPVAAMLVLAAAELWAASFPRTERNLAIAAAVFGLAVAAFWLLQVVDRVLSWRVIGLARTLFVILAVPAIVATIVLALSWDVPLRARLAISDADLRALATSNPTTWTVGLYDVMDFTRTDFGFQFTTNDDCGLAFSPDAEPDQAFDAFIYEHIEGPWYRWCLHFVD